MRYRGGGSGSAPSPSAWKMSGGVNTQQKKRKEKKKPHTHITATHLSHSRVTSLAALFMTTLDDMAPEEQVVHNVIPLKDKMPPLGFSDVQRKAKSSLTVTFVRCQSDASHTDVQLFTAGLEKTPLPLTLSICERDQAATVEFILSCFQVSGAASHLLVNSHYREQDCSSQNTKGPCPCFVHECIKRVRSLNTEHEGECC